MNMNEDKRMPALKFGCMSWEGVALSIAIVAVRAFQNGASPVESWSAFSWCLMLAPAVLPFFIWLALTFLWLIGNAFSRSSSM